MVSHGDSLGGQSCDAFMLLAIDRLSRGAVLTIEGVAALSSFAALSMVSLYIVAQLFFQHKTRHLDTLDTVEACVWLIFILVLFFRGRGLLLRL